MGADITPSPTLPKFNTEPPRTAPAEAEQEEPQCRRRSDRTQRTQSAVYQKIRTRTAADQHRPPEAEKRHAIVV